MAVVLPTATTSEPDMPETLYSRDWVCAVNVCVCMHTGL